MSSSSESSKSVVVPKVEVQPSSRHGPPPTRRTLRPRLLPRPTWTAAKRPSGRSLVPRSCRVPQCPNKNCKLASHRLYDPSTLRRLAEGVAVKQSSPGAATIGRDGIDGFPQLPIDNSLDPELRSLFHHFFSSVFDRLAGIFRGPLLAPGYKDRMLGVALTNRSYCMGLITQAHTDASIARGTFQESRDSLRLYTQLISIFRSQLAASMSHGPPDPLHIELALLVLCILISYNVTRGRFTEMQMNWNAVRHLVGIRGGVHYLTVALAYVVHVDRLCGTMSGVPPTWPGVPERLDQSTRSAETNHCPGLTGLEGRQSQLITRPVLEHVLQTCELLGLYEAFHSTSPEKPSAHVASRPSAEYLYYLRDKVDEQFAVLYARMLNQNTPSRSVLLATRIVEYPVTWANYVPTMTIDLCTELCTMLRDQDLFEVWSGAVGVLTWMLFVMVTSPWPFEGRDWAVVCLRGAVGAKYGAERWPDRWRSDELENLRDCVWPEAAYASKLEQVWKELEAGEHSTPTEEIESNANDQPDKAGDTKADDHPVKVLEEDE